MKRLFAIAAFAALTPFAVAAQEIDQQRAELVGNCLITMAGIEEEVLFHNLVTAMVAETADVATTYRAAIVARARDVGVERCNQPEEWLTLPWAGAALGHYLQSMIVTQFNGALQWFQALE